MLTTANLVALESALRQRTVLSVYVNGEERDPAKRRRWRIDLRHSFDDIERWLKDSSHEDREAFAKCRSMALDALSGFRGMTRSPGWAGFYTTEGEQFAAALPVPPPTMAAWSTGPCLAPLVRAMKESRPVIVAVVDSRRARLYRYAEHAVELVETIRAHVSVEPPSHMGRPARSGFHTGTRGATGTDEAQRELREGTSHMLAQVAERLAELAGNEGRVLLGGIPTVALAALNRLPADLALRAGHAATLDVHATKAQVASAAREWASSLRDSSDLRRVSDVLTSAQADGLGLSGSVDTIRALEEGRVRELYFTLQYLENHAADAEAAVRLALATHADVEHVSGPGAEQLDQVGGIAAALRYVRAPEGASEPAVTSAGA